MADLIKVKKKIHQDILINGNKTTTDVEGKKKKKKKHFTNSEPLTIVEEAEDESVVNKIHKKKKKKKKKTTKRKDEVVTDPIESITSDKKKKKKNKKNDDEKLQEHQQQPEDVREEEKDDDVQEEEKDDEENEQNTVEHSLSSSLAPAPPQRSIELRYMTMDKKFSPLETLKVRALVSIFRTYHSMQYHYELSGRRCELEVRMGRCQGQHFDTGVDRRMFELYTYVFLNSQTEMNLVYQEMPERVVTYYTNNIRSINGEQEQFEIVKRFAQTELRFKAPFMDLRINLKDETVYDGPPVDSESWTTQRTIKRHRFTCTTRGIQIDLSLVTTRYNHDSQPEKTSYEIEMELLPCPELNVGLLCYNRALNTLQLYGRQLEKTLKAMEWT